MKFTMTMILTILTICSFAKASEPLPRSAKAHKLNAAFQPYVGASKASLRNMDKLFQKGAKDASTFLSAWMSYCNSAKTAMSIARKKAGPHQNIAVVSQAHNNWLSAELAQWRYMSKSPFTKYVYQHGRLVELTLGLEAAAKTTPKKIKVIENWVSYLPVYYDIEELGAPELQTVYKSYSKVRGLMANTGLALHDFKVVNSRFLAHYKKVNFQSFVKKASSVFIYSIRQKQCPTFTGHQKRWANYTAAWSKRFVQALSRFEKVAKPIIDRSFMKKFPKQLRHLPYKDLGGYWEALLADIQSRLGTKKQYLELAQKIERRQKILARNIKSNERSVKKYKADLAKYQQQLKDEQKQLEDLKRKEDWDAVEDQEQQILKTESVLDYVRDNLKSVEDNIDALKEQIEDYEKERQEAIKEYHT